MRHDNFSRRGLFARMWAALLAFLSLRRVSARNTRSPGVTEAIPLAGRTDAVVIYLYDRENRLIGISEERKAPQTA